MKDKSLGEEKREKKKGGKATGKVVFTIGIHFLGSHVRKQLKPRPLQQQKPAL